VSDVRGCSGCNDFAVCCSVLQCVQCVSVWCSLLHCVSASCPLYHRLYECQRQPRMKKKMRNFQVHGPNVSCPLLNPMNGLNSHPSFTLRAMMHVEKMRLVSQGHRTRKGLKQLVELVSSETCPFASIFFFFLSRLLGWRLFAFNLSLLRQRQHFQETRISPFSQPLQYHSYPQSTLSHNTPSSSRSLSATLSTPAHTSLTGKLAGPANSHVGNNKKKHKPPPPTPPVRALQGLTLNIRGMTPAKWVAIPELPVYSSLD